MTEPTHHSTPVVLFASNNAAKVEEARKFFGQVNISVVSPSDVGITVDAPENFMTLEQNAAEKTTLCSQAVQASGKQYIIIGDDTGLEIECLNGEPGTRVRRWVGHKMTDDEIISHCLSRMESFHLPEQRKAVMRTSVCVKFPGSDAQMFFNGELHGEISRIPDPLIMIEGFPMERIFFVTEWNKLLGEVAIMEASEKSKYPTHREKALLMVLEEIKQRYNLK